EAVRYVLRREAPSSQTPMSAVLYFENEDGSAKLQKSDTQVWRSRLNAEGTWQAPDFDDSSWKMAIPYRPPATNFDDADLGNPWPTGAVKSLRRAFATTKPVTSARLYATALGAYQISINGKVVGDQVLAPGWTDFREQVIYQAYDVTSLLST